MESEVFDDLRQYIEAAKKMSAWKEIKGADWNAEGPPALKKGE